MLVVDLPLVSSEALTLTAPRRSFLSARLMRRVRRGALLLVGASLAASCKAPSRTAVQSADSDSLDVAAVDTAATRRLDSTARAADSTERPADSAVHLEDTMRVREVAPVRTGTLSILADSLSRTMTFLAKFQTVFVAAGRRHHLLLDIGRFDGKLGSPARARAYQEAVKALSPVKIGDRFRLHGPWGADEALVTGYGDWNGRLVATLDVPPVVDSLLHTKLPVVAVAVRADSSTPPVANTCSRDNITPGLATRVLVVRDSLTQLLQADTVRLPTRVLKSRRLQVSQVIGCFGAARVLLFANLSAGAYEFVHEYAALVDTTGRVVPLRVSDLRFKAHEAVSAFDADGDGVDDIAALGHGERTGGTVVLRLDPARRRLDYIMSGFAWEIF